MFSNTVDNVLIKSVPFEKLLGWDVHLQTVLFGGHCTSCRRLCSTRLVFSVSDYLKRNTLTWSWKHKHKPYNKEHSIFRFIYGIYTRVTTDWSFEEARYFSEHLQIFNEGKKKIKGEILFLRSSLKDSIVMMNPAKFDTNTRHITVTIYSYHPS